jgi:glycosidase
MRILFDSKNTLYKEPFGCLRPGEECRLTVHIPSNLQTQGANAVFLNENGSLFREFPLSQKEEQGDYQLWECRFTLDTPALHFYYFTITGKTGLFRLFKQGRDTNMEDGEKWQLTCIPKDFCVPQWAKGATIYQIFPDRFYKSGTCDLTGKLEPYEVHENWDEEVVWQPTPEGLVLNNDFFGGNFKGITEKLPYIASLGTTILYLNPISKSFSSHRYDTGDYKTPDPMLGTVEDFKVLCREAHKLGMRVILDGVYSHTGSNSLYFDKEGAFGGKGAYCSKESPYYTWFTFTDYPDKYKCWWDFDTLPTVDKLHPDFMNYIFEAEDSVLAYWMALGADGFRLDVADELPNAFMAAMKKNLRRHNPEALLMGEVWEDASTKEAYGKRLRYFVDGTLDSVMNYPFRTAILNYLRGADDGAGFEQAVTDILENYPREVIDCNMNLLGTHDTPRILTALVDEYDGPREKLAKRHLPPHLREKARQKLMVASALQYTLPGCPSLYYGDEAGMEGGKDPFNRRTYPWGREDEELLSHHRLLGQLRKRYPALRFGETEFFQAGDGRIGYQRSFNGETVRIYVNQSDAPWVIPGGNVLLGLHLKRMATDGVTIAPMGMCILEG